MEHGQKASPRVMREHDYWHSVFSGHPGVSVALLMMGDIGSIAHSHSSRRSQRDSARPFGPPRRRHECWPVQTQCPTRPAPLIAQVVSEPTSLSTLCRRAIQTHPQIIACPTADSDTSALAFREDTRKTQCSSCEPYGLARGRRQWHVNPPRL